MVIAQTVGLAEIIACSITAGVILDQKTNSATNMIAGVAECGLNMMVKDWCNVWHLLRDVKKMCWEMYQKKHYKPFFTKTKS